jgi:kynurenine formamidase
MADVPSPDEVAAISQQVSNWGRWGDDDERGALNLITDAKRATAAALVQDGVTVSCALVLPVRPAADNPTPVAHHMTIAGDAIDNLGIPVQSTGDYFAIAPHGMATTHLDALCHVLRDGKMYNGYPASVVKSSGAEKNAITVAEEGIVSRGVLLDIPALRGVDYLEPGERISAADLSAAEERQGLAVEAGDILFVRTGRDTRRDELGAWPPFDGMAGLAVDCLPWLRERDVAVLGSDGISDTLPSEIEGWLLPIHEVILPSMGVHLIDNARLGPLAAACAERGRYAFQLTIAPLRLVGGTASPINPIALF